MIYLEVLLVTALCAYKSVRFLHMMQLESYQIDGYLRWMKKSGGTFLNRTLPIGGAALLAAFFLRHYLSALFGASGEMAAHIIVMLAFIAASLMYDVDKARGQEKKPIVYTPRMRRLFATLILLSLLVCAMLALLEIPPYVIFAVLPYFPVAAAFITAPLEKYINKRYLNEARAILDSREDLIKIGITGSYGKTSTKFFLKTILSEKYETIATPGSVNTPMGVTRVIREQLKGEHQVFIAEMGARHVGDIKELVEFVRPSYGVLISVGPQHLETFGNIETVASTKYELIDGLPEDGVAFFGADGGIVDGLYEKTGIEKYRAGIGGGGYLAMRAEDIEVGSTGSRFTLRDGTGANVRCSTKVLGEHNIANIVLCCCVAQRLGMSMEQIAAGVHKTQPVEHRLQLLPGANGMTIIDDAFNSNPAGARAALDVLRAFEGRRRVIVTPGMVELGAEEEKYNYIFGSQIAASCDMAILVGRRRSRPMVKGAMDSGMSEADIHVVADLNEATAVLGRSGRPGDVVLFENDLPDNYSE